MSAVKLKIEDTHGGNTGIVLLKGLCRWTVAVPFTEGGSLRRRTLKRSRRLVSLTCSWTVHLIGEI